MKRPLDMSLGQRLGFGFALVVGVLAAFAAMVSIWHARSAEAQRALTTRVVPLSQRAQTLERAILRTGIAVRAYLLTPAPDRLRQYRQTVEETRDALQALGASPKQADGETLYRGIAAAAESYLSEADRITAQRYSGALDPGAEDRLAATRAAVVARLQAFSDLQERKLGAALVAVDETRDHVSDGLVVMSMIAALLLLVLGHVTVRAVRRPVQQLLDVASALEAGDWAPALALAPAGGADNMRVPVRDEMRKLGRSFGVAAIALKQREERLRVASLVAAAAASSLQKQEVAQAALRHIAEYIGAEIGVMYWCEPDDDILRPIARHALNGDIGPMRMGDGIPGLAAQQRDVVVLRDVPRDAALTVKFGYDQAPPRSVVAVPIVFRDELQGVFLLASLKDIEPEAVSFLKTLAMQLGIGLQNIRGHEEVARLLAEVTEKNQQIQAQNEELQAQNEEIQAQSEELQAQGEEIQAQSEELQAQNEELKQQTEELIERTELLAEAGERTNQFLGVLAHELRNPMAAITNSLMIAKRAPAGSEPAARANEVIDRQVQQLIRLIDDLLDITRISHGKMQIQTERIDLAHTARSCIDDHRLAFQAAALDIVVDVPSTPVWIDGDHTRVCQMLGNLLNNAIKFTERDKQIRVALHADARAREATLRVIDTGIGIEPELLRRLFVPFTQGRSGSARTSGGLGLGLALVKTLAEMHGGSVEARSEGIGKGAEFILRFPVKTAPNELITNDAAESLPITTPRRILVIEDSPDVADTLCELLKLEGHAVAVAHTGEEGLAEASRFRPDLVFCDIGLPGMSGYEVVRQIRHDDRLRSTFVVALTGYTSELDKRLAKRSGFDFHWAKPINAQSLKKIFAEFTQPNGELSDTA